MHFITKLPESQGFCAILVFTDRITTVQHCILAEITCLVEDHADLYIGDVWKLYGP